MDTVFPRLIRNIDSYRRNVRRVVASFLSFLVSFTLHLLVKFLETETRDFTALRSELGIFILLESNGRTTESVNPRRIPRRFS